LENDTERVTDFCTKRDDCFRVVFTTFDSNVVFKAAGKKTGVAKVRPSKDFLRPLCQILDAQLSYL